MVILLITSLWQIIYLRHFFTSKKILWKTSSFTNENFRSQNIFKSLSSSNLTMLQYTKPFFKWWLQMTSIHISVVAIKNFPEIDVHQHFFFSSQVQYTSSPYVCVWKDQYEMRPLYSSDHCKRNIYILDMHCLDRCRLPKRIWGASHCCPTDIFQMTVLVWIAPAE